MTQDEWEAWLENPVTKAYMGKLKAKAEGYSPPTPTLGIDPTEYYAISLVQETKKLVHEELLADLSPEHYESIFGEPDEDR